MGTFLVDALDKDSVKGLKEYTADNLLNFLSRQTDKDLIAELVKELRGKVNIEKNNETKAESETL